MEKRRIATQIVVYIVYKIRINIWGYIRRNYQK